MPVHIYGNETIIWKEKERPWIRVIQMNSLRGLLGRIDEIKIIWIRELRGVMKGVDEKNDEGFLRRFGHVKRMGIDRLLKNACWVNVKVVRKR